MELIELPNSILNRIILFINTTEDYNSFRSTNREFHKLMNINKKFFEGIPIEIYTFFNNKIFNENTIFYKNGFIKKINTYNEHGLKDTIQTEYYTNQKYKNIEYYTNGCKHGDSKEYYRNGKLKRVCNYKNNLKLGYEYINNFNGQIRFIKNNISPNLVNVEQYSNKFLVSEVSLHNNKLYGFCKTYTNGFIKKKCDFINGIPIGKMYNYNNYGLYEVINYGNNTKNGVYLKFNTIGNINIYANFKKNKLDGVLKIFNINSINTHLINFKDGKLHGDYITSEIFKKKYIFKNNLLNGYYKEYYNDNKLKTKIKFLNNKFKKIYKKYNYDGSINIEILFTESGYKIIKYKNQVVALTIYKINHEYYYSTNNKLVYLDSFYFNPLFYKSAVV